MKREPNPISIHRTSAFRLEPTLTSEEAIIFAADRPTDRCATASGWIPTTFLRMMRDMREKISTADNVSLIEWAARQIKDGDQRIVGPEKYARIA